MFNAIKNMFAAPAVKEEVAVPVVNAGAVTMSTLEVTELLKTRHDNVKRTVERLVERGVIVQPPTEDEQAIDAMGRVRITQVYLLNKRDSYVVVAQLSPEFTGALVDRWQELEQNAITRTPALLDSPVTSCAAFCCV